MTPNDLYSAAVSNDAERVRAIVKEASNLLTIPFRWETRYTDTGKFVSVYKSGFNEYTDSEGNKYHEAE